MKKIIMIAGIALVLVIIIAVLLFVFVFNKSDDISDEPKEFFEHAFTERYTNINAEKKILKYEMVIQYTDETVKDLLIKNESRIINDVVEYFRTRPYEQISSPTGQRKAREDILEKLLEILEVDTDMITDVFFKQFIIQ